MIAAIIASAWLIPAVSGIAAGLVAGWFGGDWILALIAAGTVAGAVLAYRLFGLKGALAALSAGVALFAYRSGERRGASAQAAKEKADADRSVDRAQRARADADRRNADPKRLRDDDGFRRD